MKKIATLFLAVTVAGCASSAAPNFVNGRYYMAGDSACERYRVLSPSRIMCFNSDGQATGYRDAMTDQQLQMYQFNQQMTVQQMQQLNAQLQQQNQQMQQQQNAWRQMPQYVAPQAAPLTPQDSNQIRCINTGPVTNCRYW
ncbi:hypothetical protein [Cupriavidus basilensis]|uniref:hypothetical protein n=1 Tax=Cupriavidus basilensis TaxID=68895 RepID=UPI0020A61FD1|nr:hypothetical protein [Cupriavidus basilensis]MCP3017577.1 hypothetical protein [Cupriavidus basilensis]